MCILYSNNADEETIRDGIRRLAEAIAEAL